MNNLGSPCRLMIDLAETVDCLAGGPMQRKHRSQSEKPGEYLSRLSTEFRAALARLRSDDIATVRWPNP
jgi:hypothetical protein